MEIIGKIQVKGNIKEKTRSIILTIGIISFVITIICEMILGNYGFIALIIPFLYLIRIKNMNASTVHNIKDVIILIKCVKDEKRIEISNCEYKDKNLCSVRFIIRPNSNVDIRYFAIDEKISIRCDAQKILILEDKVTHLLKDKYYNVEFYVQFEDAKSIARKLDSPIKIIS